MGIRLGRMRVFFLRFLMLLGCDGSLCGGTAEAETVGSLLCRRVKEPYMAIVGLMRY